MSKIAVGEVITGFCPWIIGILDDTDGVVEVKIIPDWDTLIVEVVAKFESNWLEAKDITAGEADVKAAIDGVEDVPETDVVTVEVKASTNWLVDKLLKSAE